MKISVVGVGAVLGVCLAGARADAFSASYDQKVTQGRQVVAGRVTMKDEMFRMEATVDGQAAVTIRNASGVYMYLPAEGMAMKMSGLNPSQQPIQHGENYQQYLRDRQAERIGSETVDGHSCDVYRFTDPAIAGTTTAWVWIEKQFPLRMEVDDSDGKTVIELTNIELGVAVADTAFELPANVQVMEMGAMMNAR